MVKIFWRTKKLGIPRIRRLIDDTPTGVKMGDSRRGLGKLGHSSGPKGLLGLMLLIAKFKIALLHLFGPLCTISLVLATVHYFT